MSTRANVVLRENWGDGKAEIWLYHHGDGYPEGMMPMLQYFINYMRRGEIRNNVEQSAGWLVLWGAKEQASYVGGYDRKKGKLLVRKNLFEPGSKSNGYGWKATAYEPSFGRHGDIEYLYVIDCDEMTITCYKTPDGDDPSRDEKLFVDTPENPWRSEKESQE